MNHTPDDIPATVKALGRFTVPELKQRYAEVFGEPTRTNHKQYLVRRIVWRICRRSATPHRRCCRGTACGTLHTSR